MAKAYLSLGSNIGNREEFLSAAVNEIEGRIGKVLGKSPIVQTEAWGYSSSNDFLNMALIVDTSMEPYTLLLNIKKIEKSMGRRPSAAGYSDREIDIDIIFYDDMVCKSDSLTIPHPLMHKRAFVLEPLSEIAPDKIHPVLGKTVRELLKDGSPFEGG